MIRCGKSLLMVAALTGSVFAPSRAPAAGWLDNLSITASGTASWVENISRTSAEPNRRDAASYELKVGATRHQQLASAWLLQAGAEATGLWVPEYNLNNQLTLGPRVGVQHKFGLGPLAPVLQFDTALLYKASRFEASRGWTAEGSLRLAKRLTSSFKVSASAQWLEHYARSRIFDVQQHGFSVDAFWDLNERWTLSGSAGRMSGEIVANAAWAVWGQAISGGLGATVFNYYTVRPWEITNLYGSGWVSYNVEADVDLWSLALAYRLSDHTTAELRYGSAFVVNKIGIRYPTDSWGLSVVHRF